MAIIDNLLSEADAAEQLGFSAEWMRKKRKAGKGPAYLRVGNRIMYDPKDIERWLARQRRDPSDKEPRHG